MKPRLLRTLRILSVILVSLLLLVVLLILSLNLPFVQNGIKNRVVAYLQNKTDTRIALRDIAIGFPRDITLNDFFIADKRNDTLVYAKRLFVDLDMLKLLKNQVLIKNIELEGMTANVNRLFPDTVFNYQFLADSLISSSSPEKKDTTSSLVLDLDMLNFKDIRLRYQDDVVGNFGGAYIRELHSEIDQFDLDSLNFKLKNFILAGTNIAYNQRKPLTSVHQQVQEAVQETEQKTSGRLPYIQIGDFKFTNVVANYDDRLSDTRANVVLSDMNFTGLIADLTRGRFKTDLGKLHNSVVDVAYRPTAANEQAVQETTESAKESTFNLFAKTLDFKNNRIKYSNLSQPEQPKGRFDGNHFDLTEMDFNAKEVAYDSTGIAAELTHAGFKDRSGFTLTQLKGKLAYSDSRISVSDLVLRTPQTSVTNRTTLTFNSIEDLTKRPGNVRVASVFENSRIHLGDLYYFVESIPASYRNETVRLNAEVAGYLNNLNIPRLQLSGLRSTDVDLSGNIKGLPDMDKAWFDLNIRRFNTSRSDILAFIPKKSIPQSISLPEYLNASGTFSGTLQNFETDLKTKSDLGGADIAGTFRFPKGGDAIYDADISLAGFNVGKLLKRKDIGVVSLDAHLVGTGFDPKTADAEIQGRIHSMVYNGYTYKDVNLDGKLKDQQLALNVVSDDPNAGLDIQAIVDLSGENPGISGKMDLAQLDLQKLGFAKNELKVGGVVDLNFRNMTTDKLDGTAYITSLQLVAGGKRLVLDSVGIVATYNDGRNTLDITSKVLNATLEGRYDLAKIAQAFINEVNEYYEIGEYKPVPPQRVAFDVKLQNEKLIRDFVPGLYRLANSHIHGLLDTELDSIRLFADFPLVIYNENRIEVAKLNVNNEDVTRLDYTLAIERLENPTVQFYQNEITGSAADNRLDLSAFLRDTQGKDKYTLGASLQSVNDNYRVSIHPGELTLNYDTWDVSPGNLFQFGKSGIWVQNFRIGRDSQSIVLNSLGPEPGAPLDVELNNLRLSTITKFADQDTSLLGGLLYGHVIVNEFGDDIKLDADVFVDSLRYKQDQLGNLALNAMYDSPYTFATKLSLTGIHDIQADGFFVNKPPKPTIDLTVDLNKLDLSKVENLVNNEIRKGSGDITGTMSVKGPLADLSINGDINFNEVGLVVSRLNSYFRVKDETVSFRENGIHLNQFTITDTLGKELNIIGSLYTSNYRDFYSDLIVQADDFKLMNSTDADNDQFYGTLFLDVDATVEGNVMAPRIGVEARVNEGTRFFFELPEDDPSVVEHEGVVEWINKDAPPFNMRALIAIDSIINTPLNKMDFSGNLSIDPDAEITIVVDPANGDALKVKGQADLSLQMDASDKVSITGRYELASGSYNLTLQGIARREFTIQHGSSIQWTGAPTKADVDIRAIYQSNAAPIDLVADQITGFDELSQNRYKQRIPFNVVLKMKGELLKPVINFEIDMPERYRNTFEGIVWTRIQQVNTNESDLNKQVFALLAFNRFLQDNPFESLATNQLGEDIIRNSVSRILAQQLNNLAANLIRGIDIHFDVNMRQDYSTGIGERRTDLNMQLAKAILNNRLSFSVGNNFEVEGARAGTPQAITWGSDINVEYLLSRDGQYRLRGYRINQTEGLIEGRIIETGLGFTMIVNYDKFSDFFDSFKKSDSKRRRTEP